MEIKNEHRLTEVEERSKSNTRRIESIEKRQDDFNDLIISVKTLAQREETVEKDVKEIKSDVKSLTGKPGKKWDSLVNQIIIAVTAAVIGFILAQIGL